MINDTPPVPLMVDTLGRPMGSLRISVIDRCDLRCAYCMPEEDYTWLPTKEILSFDEIEILVDAFTQLGVNKVRITGGEPLLRRNLPDLVERLAGRLGVQDLAMTTNATQLAKWAEPLRRAGLERITISLDSLQPERFASLTRRHALDQVLDGIRAAAGYPNLKINTVVMRGFNDDEVPALIEFGKEVGAQVRFIEYMDVGGATRWSMQKVFSRADILRCLEDRYGPVEVDGKQGVDPAQRFRLSDGTRFGIIASVTEPFCRACDRSRLTADGIWYLCLYATEGVNLAQLLRQGASHQEVVEVLQKTWSQRRDRGAEVRREVPTREVLYQVDDLRRDPHREMHTRGG